MSIEQRLAACLGYLNRLENEWGETADLPASQAQIQLVMWIGQHPNCRLQHIAAGLSLTAPTVSVGVRRMEQMGLIERSSDSSDLRAISLVLSPTGEQLYQLALTARTTQMKNLLERLRPAEQRHLVEMLERMLGMPIPEGEQLRETEAAPELKHPSDKETPPAQLSLFGS
ncbi:MAG: MarR family winged helix-turn-helix transcriptional regulator [Chloroflexi bacterium]|nr:MarR family winged helix-turn-helix transcriptional regulator [Chloroflexota bacterium]